MCASFRSLVRRALSDSNLQLALDRNAERRAAAWSQAFTSLPDADGLRRKAQAVRKTVLEDFDRHLDQFAAQVQANGLHVHRATDADEAARIVADVVHRHETDVVAKSKTMVSEEIGLNEALSKAGVRVVETDLGEFIVQLRGEPPSHIITPAVHLLKEDVAETFSQQLGMPYSDRVDDLNAAARSTLRQVFLSAQVGVSGVNFGVVENGVLCLVTNEGNGRMVSTLPPVHVALMGVERMVPTMADLSLMLELLPRSATGQKISSYVSLIRQPRGEGDPDGPNERHLVLVDNGRRKVINSWFDESLYCIRCGACLNVCPVFREIGGHTYQSVYSGPIGSVISPALFGMRTYGHLATASTLCGACRDVCPVQIDLPKLLLRVRRDYRDASPQSSFMRMVMRIFAWMMESPVRLRTAQRLAGWVTNLIAGGRGWLRRMPPPFSRWTRTRDFPPFASRPFRDRFDGLILDSGRITGMPSESNEPHRPVDNGIHEPEDVVQRFERELQELGGEFVRCESKNVADVIGHRLRDLNVRHLAVAKEVDPIVGDFVRRLGTEGFELHEMELPRDGPERAARLREWDCIEVGLTAAVAGIAETGTLVLPSGADRSQLASLMPPVHVAILPEAAIFATRKAWLAAEGSRWIDASSCLTLASGPSRTADIEMTLTIGVHGPGKLIVVCCV